MKNNSLVKGLNNRHKEKYENNEFIKLIMTKLNYKVYGLKYIIETLTFIVLPKII